MTTGDTRPKRGRSTDTGPAHQPHQRPGPGHGPRIVRKPPPEDYGTRTFTFTQKKLDAVIAQRVGETKAKYAPRAALADQLTQALAHEVEHTRALEAHLRVLGYEPLPRPTIQKDTTDD
jgi:hypothetical protein